MTHIPETVAERSRDQEEEEDLDANPPTRPPLTLRGLRESLRATLGDRKDTHLHLFLVAPEIDLDFAISVLDTGAEIAENEPDNDLEKWTARYASAEEVLEVLESLEDPGKVRADAYERAGAFAISVLDTGAEIAENEPDNDLEKWTARYASADLAMDSVGRTRSPQGASTARNIARVLRDAAGADVREETLRGIRPADDAELAEAVATGVEQGRMIALRTLEEQEAALRAGLWTPDKAAAADALQAAGAALREAVNPYLRPVENETEARLRASLISAVTLLARVGLPDAVRRERALQAVQQRVLTCFRRD